jgi:hypothetical protein
MKWLYCATIFTGLLLLPQNASALSRWECKGVTPDTIVLTPYQDGSVNLSFNGGDVQATAPFSHAGDVFSAIFKDLNGVANTLYIVVIDTMTKGGYEIFQFPNRPSGGATKIVCFWYQK